MTRFSFFIGFYIVNLSHGVWHQYLHCRCSKHALWQFSAKRKINSKLLPTEVLWQSVKNIVLKRNTSAISSHIIFHFKLNLIFVETFLERYINFTKKKRKWFIKLSAIEMLSFLHSYNYCWKFEFHTDFKIE